MALAKLAQQKDAHGVLEKGMILGDRFVVEGAIGEGGMGAVYAGLDRTTGQRVAIKVVQASSSQELDALHRFLREASSAALVTHPAVVRMLHVDVSDDGMLFQVQELVDGVTLQQRVRMGQRWEAGAVARVGSVLCEALAAAHARGVVHRDVKPGNVMLTKDPPGLKLLDFGIAKLYEHALEGDAGTRTGAILGTPAFMAPEQIDGTSEVVDRSDVYAVGVILFLLLTGKYPFGDATPRRMLLNHVLLRPPDVRELEASVPADLAEIVGRCLLKEPPERPEAAEIARALAAFADAHGAPELQELEIAGTLRDVEANAAELQPTAITGRRGVA
jgi:serine/threonine-protein kinase